MAGAALKAAVVIGVADAFVSQWQPHDVELSKLRKIVESQQSFQVKVSEQCEGAGNIEDCTGRVSDKFFCQLLSRSKMASHPEVSLHCVPGTAAATPTVSIPKIKGANTAEVETPSPLATKTTVEVKANSTVALKANSTVVEASKPVVKANATVAAKPVVQANSTAAKAKQFLQKDTQVHVQKAPEDELAKEMTHDLEMNFNKIAPFGKEDTAKELQDHAAKTQDTLVDAVENAEVAEIKRAVFRALTRLRAATIKEFDTIARLETQAIDAYNDAHHYRAENPLAHLHEDEAPVETDKLKSFH
jgi:hypothetical protein